MTPKELIITALHQVYERIAGLPEYADDGTTVANFYAYQPTSLATVPALFTLDNGLKPNYAGGQRVAIDYSFVTVIAVQWIDFEQAELEARPLSDLVLEAVEADPYLGTTLDGGGTVVVERIEDTIRKVGDVAYRCIDVSIVVTYKRPRVARYVPTP